MALNKACLDAVFISLPKAGHGLVREATTLRSTAAVGCKVTNPAPYVPTWKTVTEFLDRHMGRSHGRRLYLRFLRPWFANLRPCAR